MKKSQYLNKVVLDNKDKVINDGSYEARAESERDDLFLKLFIRVISEKITEQLRVIGEKITEQPRNKAINHKITFNATRFSGAEDLILEDINKLIPKYGWKYHGREPEIKKLLKLIFTEEDANNDENIQDPAILELLELNDENITEPTILELSKLIIAKFPHLKKYIDLGKLIHYYDPVSIDSFLSSVKKQTILIEIDDGITTTKDDLICAGKELIAYYLLKAEDEGIFNSNNKIWYRWLRNEIIRIGGNEEEIIEGLKNINIISFNYDRSLEEYLKKKLSEKFYDTIKKNIHYPYGSLHAESTRLNYGDLKLRIAKNTDNNSKDIFNSLFGEGEGEKDGILAEFAKGIRVIDEDRSSSKKERIMQNSLKNTDRIYFLGFAFLPENCETKSVLDLNNISENKSSEPEIYYTNFEGKNKVSQAAQRYLVNFSRIKKAHISHKGVYEALEQDFELNFK